MHLRGATTRLGLQQPVRCMSCELVPSTLKFMKRTSAPPTKTRLAPGMSPRRSQSLALVACAVLTAEGLSAVEPYDDWECPGFPCFITNVFEYHKYTKISQTCGYVDDMTVCNALTNGKSFNTGNVTHPVSKPHPCYDYYMCRQTSCVQGSVASCISACKDLNLLDYNPYAYFGQCIKFCNSTSSGCASWPPPPSPPSVAAPRA